MELKRLPTYGHYRDSDLVHCVDILNDATPLELVLAERLHARILEAEGYEKAEARSTATQEELAEEVSQYKIDLSLKRKKIVDLRERLAAEEDLRKRLLEKQHP